MSSTRWYERVVTLADQRLLCRSGRIVHGAVELDIVADRVAARLIVETLEPPEPMEKVCVELVFRRPSESVRLPVSWNVDLTPSHHPVGDFVMTPFRPGEIDSWRTELAQLRPLRTSFRHD